MRLRLGFQNDEVSIEIRRRIDRPGDRTVQNPKECAEFPARAQQYREGLRQSERRWSKGNTKHHSPPRDPTRTSQPDPLEGARDVLVLDGAESGSVLEGVGHVPRPNGGAALVPVRQQ